MKKTISHAGAGSAGISRRSFLMGSLAALAATGVSGERGPSGTEPASQGEGLKIKEYRTLGRTEFKVSDIGFGTPELTAPPLLATALDMGINYIDTAEEYRGGGSERTIGEVIKNRDRSKLFITTKMHLRETDRKVKIVNKALASLERLKTDYVDCLMIHMPFSVEQIKNEFFHKAIKELKARGKVRFAGLSNHGTVWEDAPESMETVCLAAVEDGRFDVLLFAYNFLQRDQGEKILQACRDREVGAALMKTDPVMRYLQRKSVYDKAVAEGKQPAPYLEKILPGLEERIDSAKAFMQEHDLTDPDSIRDGAVKFALTHPHAGTVCLTIKNFGDLESFVGLSGKRLNGRDETGLALYASSLGRFYCRHACGLCEPDCPQQIPVNTIMRYHHYFQAQGREATAVGKYAALPGKKADACARCPGHCQGSCPYGVPIQDLLTSAHRTLSLA
jgi:predicted aldo/keto reductase-like oxidoreductase